MRQRGFTLIEIVIVVALAAFLLAAAMPSAMTWIRNSRIRTAAESISGGLQQARNEAVRRNQQVSFYLVSDAATSMSDNCILSATSSGWVIAQTSPEGKCATERDSFVALRPPGDTALSLSVAAQDSATVAATTVTFNGYGQVVNAAAISCVRVGSAADASARALNIAVNSGGQVRMCDPAVSDANDPRRCVGTCS